MSKCQQPSERSTSPYLQSWKENNHIWWCGKNRAQESAVAGGMLINSQEAIQHRWECTGVHGGKSCSLGTYMRHYNTENIEQTFLVLFFGFFWYHRRESDLNIRKEPVEEKFQTWHFSWRHNTSGNAETSAMKSLVSSCSVHRIWQTVSFRW